MKLIVNELITDYFSLWDCVIHIVNFRRRLTGYRPRRERDDKAERERERREKQSRKVRQKEKDKEQIKWH